MGYKILVCSLLRDSLNYSTNLVLVNLHLHVAGTIEIISNTKAVAAIDIQFGNPFELTKLNLSDRK